MGNSSGVIIPKPLLTELGVVTGDVVDLALIEGRILLDQIRTVDKRRLLRRVDEVEAETLADTMATLRELFAD